MYKNIERFRYYELSNVAVSLGKRFSTFRMAQNFIRLLRGPLDPEDGGTRFVRNVENPSPHVRASHHRRPESPPESPVQTERHASRIGSRMRFVLLSDGLSVLPQNDITTNFLSQCFISLQQPKRLKGQNIQPKRATVQYTCVHVK